MVSDSKNPIDVRFFLLFIPAAYASYLFHELGHWSVGEILGNRMVYSLNLVWPEGGHYAQESHALYVSMAGPAFNVIQAAIASLTIEKFRVLFAYPFAFFPLFNRIFSLLFGGFSMQDEARIAVLLGTGTYVVAIIVVGMLLSIVVWCSHMLRIGFKANAYMVTMSTICQLLVIATYELIKV
jgi:hypothetical protein